MLRAVQCRIILETFPLLFTTQFGFVECLFRNSGEFLMDGAIRIVCFEIKGISFYFDFDYLHFTDEYQSNTVYLPYLQEQYIKTFQLHMQIPKLMPQVFLQL